MKVEGRQIRQLNIVLAGLLLACASTVCAEEPNLEALLQQIIAEYGGEENLRKLDNHIQEWDVVALVGARHGTDTRRIRVPDQLKVEISYPDKQERRIVNGESGYFMHGNSPPRLASKPQKDAMRLQLMRHYSPLVLRGKLDSLSLGKQDGYHVIIWHSLSGGFAQSLAGANPVPCASTPRQPCPQYLLQAPGPSSGCPGCHPGYHPS